MITKNSIKLSYKDYLLYPEDGKRHEIINGDHFMTPAPNVYHQFYLKKIIIQMEKHLNKTKQGIIFFAPFDVILSDYDVVQPDIVFLLNKNLHLLQESGIFGSPDLVVEILSHSTENRDKVLKKDIYTKYNIPGYWIVDPIEKLIYQYKLEGNKYNRIQVCDKELRSTVISGLVINLGEVFISPF